MAFLKKLQLSESAFGEGIKIWSVSREFPTLIHKSNCGNKDVHELWLWAFNKSDSIKSLSFEIFSGAEKISNYSIDVPSSKTGGHMVIWPGLILSNNVSVKAHASSSDDVIVYGHVNVIDQTNSFADLTGFGENTNGESTHPYSTIGRKHEIKYNANGDTIACGNGFNLALRPNGSVFSWGGANLVKELLNPIGHIPWSGNVDVYTASTDTIVASNGIPPHNTPYKSPTATNPGNNPNKASEQNHYFLIPKTPIVTGTHNTAIPRGDIGIALNGIPFDIRSAEIWSGMNQWEQVAGPGDLGVDSCGGHVQPNGKYHYHINPTCLHDMDSGEHSPIIGYAFDGLPIYGPYGYTNTGVTGSVSLMTSSYRLKAGNRPSGSGVGPGGAYDGTYSADYEFVEGHGILDRCNARFAVTPEHSSGSWHYHATVDTSGTAVYPYIVGPNFRGVPLQCNWNGGCKNTVAFPPRNIKNLTKIRVGANHALGLDKNGKVIAWGDNTYGQCNVHPNLSNGATDISAGKNHSLAVQAGQVIAWGDNEFGQTSSSPALRHIESLQITNSGQDYSLPPVVSITAGGVGASGAQAESVLAGRGILSISLVSGGANYTEAPNIVFSGGGGSGAAATVMLTSFSENPAYGYVSSITITNSGNGYTSTPTISFEDTSNACTGYGICGTGAHAVTYLQKAQVSGFIMTNQGAGYYESPAVTITNANEDTAGNGAVATGVLGGPRSGISYPVQINGQAISDVVSVSAGEGHSLSIDESGVVVAWGNNSSSQSSVPAINTSQEKWTSVVAGGNHSLGTIYNSTENLNYIRAWGSNVNGQTAVPSYATLSSSLWKNKNLSISAGENHSLILNPNGSVTGFGINTNGQLPTGLTNVSSVVSGPTSNHSFSTINEVYKKEPLSSSNSGCGISVATKIYSNAPCVDKTHIHRASNVDGVEELWMWAYNGKNSEVDLEIYLEPKETSSLSSAEILNGGSGYRQEPEITVSGGGGAGAVLTAQWDNDVPGEAERGYVSQINISNPGSGYKYPPAILISGGSETSSEITKTATFKSYIETGDKISYKLPPKASGLYMLVGGLKLENSFNVRASMKDSFGNLLSGDESVQIYGHIIRQDVGPESNITYGDSPYLTTANAVCPPITRLTSNAVSGASSLSVSNTLGFYNSQQVVVDPYLSNEENITVTGISSLLVSGLVKDHSVGAWIVDKQFYDQGSVSSGGSSGSSGGSSGGSGLAATTTTTNSPGIS